MNADLTKWTKSDLKKYEERIEELDDNFDKITLHGRYQAGGLLRYKYKILFSINHLEKENIDLTDLKAEYERINKKFMTFVQTRDKAYLDKLYEELKNSVDKYYVTICSFLKLDPIDIETGHDIFSRDSIEFLLEELENDYDLHDMKVKVAALDEALKCKFAINMDVILKEFSDIEYYPEKFWWRHPSKILGFKSDDRGRSAKNLDMHLRSHGKEFGLSGNPSDFTGKQQYVDMAVNLINRRNDAVETYYGMQGENLLIYNRVNNELVVGNLEAEIQTLFKPGTLIDEYGMAISYVDYLVNTMKAIKIEG